MFKKVLLITMLLVFAAASISIACEGNCRTILDTSGYHKQQSSAYLDKAVVKKGNIKSGGQAVATQKTSGSYKAKGGIGATAGIGIATVTVKNSKNEAFSSGLAGNIAASGAIGRQACAKIKGSGSVETVAVKGGGVASTSGGYKYAGQTGNGAVIGGGVTAGFSHVKTSRNTVTSTAGHGTASGVISLGGLN